ncbi:transcriptional regulator, GntR family [Salipiger thiooxidans]|uniref:Transcriptional regulator, GntR family n=1 Tax=Salipiger thiooxidans TaxID=282683 RepID=A0A1G7LJT9_9RHOB|nr:transcriptional regulator, GntR family [Salipiger thiooxidans]
MGQSNKRPVITVFKPVKSIRTFEAISDQIRRQIETGVLQPGDKLPSDRELAVQFGVSRNSVREALRILESASILELQQGASGGAFILEGDGSNVSRSISDMMALKQISLQHVTEARVELMNVILRLACENADASDFELLEKNINTTRAAVETNDLELQMESTKDFYTIIAQSTKNPMYTLIVAPISEVVRRFVREAGIRIPIEVVKTREQLLQLLRDRDAEGAIAVLSAHLDTIHEAILHRSHH